MATAMKVVFFPLYLVWVVVKFCLAVVWRIVRAVFKDLFGIRFRIGGTEVGGGLIGVVAGIVLIIYVVSKLF